MEPSGSDSKGPWVERGLWQKPVTSIETEEYKANMERLFSCAGNLSDPNMDPHFLAYSLFLAILTRIAPMPQQEGV